MHDKIFIDTNIFLYAFSDKDSRKQATAKEIVLDKSTISVQVINETSNNLIKKLGLDENSIKYFIQSAYMRYQVVNFSRNIFIKASDIRMRYQYSYYDSLIIAAALESQCTLLYSEDMHNAQVIDDILTIINPFLMDNRVK
jgi:predicted nucleic acid-binding protein